MEDENKQPTNGGLSKARVCFGAMGVSKKEVGYELDFPPKDAKTIGVDGMEKEEYVITIGLEENTKEMNPATIGQTAKNDIEKE